MKNKLQKYNIVELHVWVHGGGEWIGGMEASSQVLVGEISDDDTDCVEGKQNIRYNFANSAC